MVDMLRRGEADIGIAMNDEPHAEIDIELVATSEIVALLPHSHPLAARKKLGFSDLAETTLISYRPQSLPGQLLARAAATGNATLEPAIEIDVSIIAAPFVQQGIGVALVDGLLPWSTFAGLVTRPFRPRVELPVCLLASRTRAPSQHQHTFAEHVRAAVLKLGRDRGWGGVLTPTKAGIEAPRS